MPMISTIVPEMPTSAPLPPEFTLGTIRVCPTESGGFWLYPRAARARFIPAGSSTATAIQNGQTLEGIDKIRRTYAEGTHEPLVYFRNAEGKIAIPPDPNLLPPGVERLEANSLRAIENVMSELNLDHFRDFEDTGEFQAGLEEMAQASTAKTAAAMKLPASQKDE